MGDEEQIDWTSGDWGDDAGYSDTGEEVQDWQNTDNSGMNEVSDSSLGYSDTDEKIQDWQNVSKTGDTTSGNLNAFDSITKFLSSNPKLAGLAKTLGATGIAKLADNLMGVTGGPGGYRGGIPTLTASRQQLAIPQTMTDASGKTVPRRPGSGGVTYFSPMQYLAPGQAPATTATSSPGITSLGGATGKINTVPSEMVAAEYPSGGGDRPLSHVYTDEHRASDEYLRRVNPTFKADKEAGMNRMAAIAGQPFAAGGIANLGGYSDGGRLLKGPGDGVSDSIPAMIGDKQPARLADGEFVIPARIVSELGNGSTEAGARKLYAMMDRIKKARKKAKNIAADTKSDKHLPA
jgi:hypothetical protein